jgi:hypothetical protein
LLHNGVVAGQIVPQPPQFAGVLMAVSHPLLTSVEQWAQPSSQAPVAGITHLPCSQRTAVATTWGRAVQSLPHAPQFLGEVIKSPQPASTGVSVCRVSTGSTRVSRSASTEPVSLPGSAVSAPSELEPATSVAITSTEPSVGIVEPTSDEASAPLVPCLQAVSLGAQQRPAAVPDG